MTRLARLTYLLAVALVLAACGQEEILPTPTPEPLAFFAPTPLSPGRSANPLQILFVPPDAESIGNAAPTLEGELEARSGLALTVGTVGSPGEALNALCDYNDGDRFVAAWLDGPTTVLALERGCGDVALQGVRGGSTGLAGVVLGRGGGLGSVPGRTFCRLELTDFYSWVLPNLALEANNIDPTDIGDVFDYPSYDLLLPDMVNGTCQTTGAPAGLLQSEEYAEFANQIPVAYTSPPMPYGVLVYPPELLLADREALTEAFIEAVGDGVAVQTTEEADEAAAVPTLPNDELIALDESLLTSNQTALLNLLGAEGVRPVNEGELVRVQDFMQSTGLVEVLAQP